MGGGEREGDGVGRGSHEFGCGSGFGLERERGLRVCRILKVCGFGESW